MCFGPLPNTAPRVAVMCAGNRFDRSYMIMSTDAPVEIDDKACDVLRVSEERSKASSPRLEQLDYKTSTAAIELRHVKHGTNAEKAHISCS